MASLLSNIRAEPDSRTDTFVAPRPCVIDVLGAHTVPHLQPTSIFASEIRASWPYFKDLQQKFHGHLLRSTTATIPDSEFLRLPDLPVFMDPRTGIRPVAMTFVCPEGKVTVDGTEITGQLFLACLPDNREGPTAKPYESTPLMSHFMNDPNLPPIARIAEFLRLLEAKTAEREKEAEGIGRESESAKEVEEMVTRPSVENWRTGMSRAQTPVIGMDYTEFAYQQLTVTASCLLKEHWPTLGLMRLEEGLRR